MRQSKPIKSKQAEQIIFDEKPSGKEMNPQNLKPVAQDIKFISPDGTTCSFNQCIEKFDAIDRRVLKTAKRNAYYSYSNVCNECGRRYVSSRNKVDTNNSKRRADLGYREIDDN